MSNLPPNRHPFEVEAFVLKYYDYNERDRILVLYSRTHGLLRAIAKGVRSARSKMAGLCDLLRCNHLVLQRGRNLHKITQCEPLRSFPGLTKDYHALIHGLVLAEFITCFCQEEDSNEYLFSLLLHSLEALSQGAPPLPVLIWFELQLLEQLGYQQDWNVCAHCAQAFTPRDYHFFDTLEGGLRCERCKTRENCYLNNAQVECLRQLQKQPYPPLQPLVLKTPALKQIQFLLQTYLEKLAEKPLKALAFLRQSPPTEVGGLSLYYAAEDIS